MASSTRKVYRQPTTTAITTPSEGRFSVLLARSRAIISILLDIGRLIDRGAALIA